MTESSVETCRPSGERICPICQACMQSVERSGSKADICTEHGVWLDDGELDKLLNSARRRGRGNRSAVAKARRKGVIKGLFWGTWALLDDGSDSSRRSRARQLPLFKSTNGQNNAALTPEGNRNCPVCDRCMKIESCDNIIIDGCPTHGVWLDGDELTGIVSRARNRARIKTRAHVRRAHRDGVVDANLFGLFSLFH